MNINKYQQSCCKVSHASCHDVFKIICGHYHMIDIVWNTQVGKPSAELFWFLRNGVCQGLFNKFLFRPVVYDSKAYPSWPNIYMCVCIYKWYVRVYLFMIESPIYTYHIHCLWSYIFFAPEFLFSQITCMNVHWVCRFQEGTATSYLSPNSVCCPPFLPATPELRKRPDACTP